MQINQLPPASSLNNQDKFAVDTTDGITKSITASALVALTRTNSYGSPLVADTVTAMTDTSKVYVYTGNETGYTNGDWYYYNGTAWVPGGVYNSVAVNTDTTLRLSGVAADAKAVGDADASLAADITALDGTLSDQIEDIFLNTATDYDSLSFPVSKGQYCLRRTNLYKARQDIPTIEAWNIAHWEQVNIGNELYSVGDGIDSAVAAEATAREAADNELKSALGACEDDLYDMIGMFEFSWEKGGMASSTGINYNSDSNIRTNFKPVSNAKSIIVKNTSGSTAAVYEFAGNQTTASGINERLAVNYIAPNTSTSITLNANTAYIRCQLPSGTLTDGDYYLLVYTFNSIIANEFKSAFKRGYRLEYGLDLNNYTDSGYYGLDGSEYQNSPARDGVLIVYNYYNTIYISQMLLTFSNVNKSRCYIRSGRAGDNPSWTDWIELLRNDTPVISNNKIAVFGDSIMSGTVKTPTSNQTHVVGLYIQQQLKTKVVDGAIGSIGYITHDYLSYNILELVKSVDLSGCKFFVCSAGDNDYQYPIGVYTDTNTDYSDYAATDSGATVMGNIYKLCKYLHETYNDMTIVLCNKPNATTSGTFPTYRRTIGTRVQQLNAELKNFCEYYGCGFIDFDKIGFDGWMLPQVLENDGVHLTADGYKKLSVFISGELLKFTGTGDCLDSTTDRVTYPS